MDTPDVEISESDSIQTAEEKVARAYRSSGGVVYALEHLNTLLPTSGFCHFFQIELEARRHVVVVNVRPWDEATVLAVLNILLSIRMDPDPPGPPPFFRFFGPHPAAPVLLTLFGDGPESEFECRAALVVGYGADIRPDQCYQLAAAAIHLLSQCFGVKTSFEDAEADLRIGEVVSQRFRTRFFPEGGAPLNSLVILGFLYGELLRLRLPYLSRWERRKEYDPWPVLVFGRNRNDAEGGQAEAPPEARLQVVFHPLDCVIGVFRGEETRALRDAAASLERRCEDALGAIDET